MPANTPRGFPYPLPTEPVAEGAQAIRNLAESADGIVPVRLADILVSAPQPTIAIPSIPQTSRHLVVIAALRGDNASHTLSLGVRVNGDGGNNYGWQILDGSGAAVTGLNQTAQNMAVAGLVCAGSETSGVFASSFALLPDYRAATAHVLSGHASRIGSLNYVVRQFGGYYGIGAAITSLTFYPYAGAGNFVAGSRLTLYGLP